MAEAAAVTCESRETLIALLVEGDLEGADRVELDAHLAACARCREFAAELTRCQESLKELALADLDPGALAEVRYRVRESLDRPRPAAWRVWALAAAAVIALVALLVARRAPVTKPEVPAADVAPMPAPPAAATVVASVTPDAPAPPAVAEHRSSPPMTTPTGTVRRRPPATRRATITVEPPLPAAPDSPPSAVVKLKTSDPDVVIYWVEDSNGGPS